MTGKRTLQSEAQQKVRLSFLAHSVVVQDEEESWLVGFTDDPLAPLHHLTLQRAHEFDAQDIQFDMATYHVERDDQGRSCYGGIASFDLYQKQAVVNLDLEGSLRLDALSIEIHFDVDEDTYARLKQQLKRIFSGTTYLAIHD